MSELDPRWGTLTSAHDPALLAGFRPRSTDVLITTAPKCGTTWMQQILHQLRTGGDDDYGSIYEVVPWLEFPRPGLSAAEILARYEGMPDPRVFKTHCTAAQTPGIEVVRLVMTSRDPRDACVSMYHHKRDMTEEARARMGYPAPASLDEHVAQWVSFGAWFRNVESWWPERHRPNLLWLRYEDLVADLPAAVDRLSAFLGWPLRDRERVLERCSFAWMKARSDRFTRRSASDPVVFKPGGFIRAGRVGDRVELDAAQEAAIMDRVRQMDPELQRFLGLA